MPSSGGPGSPPIISWQWVEHLPLAPDGARASGARFHPQEGPYAEARNELLDRYAAAGKSVGFTGLGRDEAMKVRAGEHRMPPQQLYVRWLQEVRRFRPSTVSRRLSVVAGFYAPA